MTRKERLNKINEERTRRINDSINYLNDNNYIVTRKEDFKDTIMKIICLQCIRTYEDDDGIVILSKNEYYKLRISYDGYRFVFEEYINNVGQMYPEVWSYENHEIYEMFEYLYEKNYL